MKKLALILAILIALSCPISAWAAADTVGFYDSVLSGIGSGASSNESADTINAGAFSDGSGILSAWGDEPAAEEPAAEEPADSSADYEYILLTDGTAGITGYTGTDARITIPAQLDGHRVTAIASAFYRCDFITSVVIPDGVTYIGENAFTGCTALTEITIPDSVTGFGYAAFSACRSLRKFTVPAGVVSMEGNPLLTCTSLTEINVDPDNPRYAVIDGVLFDMKENSLICHPAGLSRQEYTVPAGLKTIARGAFCGNPTLTAVTISEGVSSIETSAFASCTALTQVDLPDSLTTIGSVAFYNCDALTEIAIPAGVTSIEADAFKDCDNITLLVEPGSYAEQYAKENGIACAAAAPAAADSGAVYTYDLFDDGTVMITAYNGSAERLVIPEEIDGYKVIAIGSRAFENCNFLKEIVLPEGLDGIGAGAFMNCFGLTSVTIPDSVTVLGQNPFIWCAGLTEINISPDHPCFELRDGMLIDRRENKLIYCPYTFTAENYEIPQDIKVIGGWAFAFCELIDNITVPASVTTIEDYAFAFCLNTETITVPESVTTIGTDVFLSCNSLTLQVEPGSHAEQYAKENGIPYETIATAAPAAVERELVGEYTSGDYEYNLYSDGTAEITKYTGKAEELTIPAKLDGHPVTGIGDQAFFDRYSLTTITIPDSVVELGANPFRSCGSLIKIIVSSNHPTLATIDGVLFDKTEKKLICYPYAYDAESYAIPQGILAIGDSAFYYCDSLTAITIPDSVTSIGDEAFSCCTSLTAITIPDSVTSIGDKAFFWCCSLTTITIPDSVTSIGKGAFYDCGSLTSITIPDSVTSIGEKAFNECPKLTLQVESGSYAEQYAKENGIACATAAAAERELVGEYTSGDYEYNLYSDGTAEISDYTGSAKELSIPAELDGYPVTSIGDEAFYRNDSLTSITIPEGVTSIGDWAFRECDSLTSITIPDSVTSISDAAFYKCYSLTTIAIPDSVTSISAAAFAHCSSLTSITIPDGVTSIVYSAFNDCDSLTSITIPEGVTSIGDWAFYHCDSLSSVTIPDSVTEIGDEVFDECPKLTLQVESGSCAEKYAKDNDIPYKTIENTDWLNA